MNNFTKKVLCRLCAMMVVAVAMIQFMPTASAASLDPIYVAQTAELRDAISISTEKQEKAHHMAELAREFGMVEESETIKYAQSVWSLEANKIRDYTNKLNSNVAVDLHYNISSKTGLSVDAFNRMLDNTALEGQGQAFYDMEQTYNVNAVFAMGVANTESTLGAACYGYNPFGMLTGSGRLICYDSWYDGIMAFGKLMTNKLYAGKSISAMANTYCPTNGGWGSEVKSAMSRQYTKIM